MKLKMIALLLVYTHMSIAQNFYKKGEIISSISVSEDTKETFALYLPKSFEASQPSSVVFIFEPAGRGEVGIKPFIESSETYNHILICSNNSRNGSNDANFEIINRLFLSVFSKFKIDDKQVFLAGFSGGSRLASTIAVMTNKIAGVIACGAGFPLNQAYMPTIQKFSYVGICGKRDMNYTEMLNVKKHLKLLKFSNTLITYDGNHSWPPSKEILKAFDWLAIQLHKKKIKLLSKSEVFNNYEKSYSLAKQSEFNSKPLMAYENYERSINTYQAFYDLDSISIKYKKLQKSKAYKNSKRVELKMIAKETQLTNIFSQRFLKDDEYPEKANIHWWKKELDKLKPIDDNPSSKEMVERLKYKIFAWAAERNDPSIFKSSALKREFYDTICKLIYPKYRRR